MLILKNNRIIRKNNATISIFSEAFMYGFGVFETLRTYNSKTFELEAHINRLFNSAKEIKLKIPYSKKRIETMVKKLVKLLKFENQLIKIISTKEDLFIISSKLKYKESLIKDGVAVKTIELQRKLPSIKSISYLSSYIANNEAKNKNYYEALLIDSHKNISEGAYSNIFWFERDKLCTNSKNILHGITREIVIKISPFKVKYKGIKLSSLLNKKEIFLTQTSKGIIPVVKIDKTIINKGVPGHKTKELIKRFSDYALGT
ncbi:hypothetical protein GF354_02195 [Candidatus Peregrinibacteria bacterium]|nr:hypothetical protein [Candidatus Peregrinibacteria bacterium]